MSSFSTSPFEENGNHYSVAVDMNYFHPSEMSVKVIDNTVVVVEAKHKERPDDQFGCISRHFLHRYRLPNNVDPTSITSDLSDKGILTVTATKVKHRSWRRSYPYGGIDGRPRNGMDDDFDDETAYIHDDYEHPVSGLFYTVTRFMGSDIDKSGGLDGFEAGCKCPESRCTPQQGCTCLRYGINYRWVQGGGLILDESKFGHEPVFECNFRCSCYEDLKKIGTPVSDRIGTVNVPFGLCPNRNVQFGPVGHLDVFDAGSKGLGLRTKRRILRGSFICEYAGEVIGLEEAKKRQKNRKGEMNFVFVLREYTGHRLSCVTCVDPSRVGNIGRYINHSCRPNAAIVPVRVNDFVPWLCVFALRDIEVDEEICYDYSGRGAPEVAEDDEAESHRKACLCGESNCKKFLPFDVDV